MSVGYRMRLLALKLWEKWRKLRLYRARTDLGIDGTNSGSERCIGKSKVQYKTMHGYKRHAGMCNDIVLTQWRYSGAPEHDLVKAMGA